MAKSHISKLDYLERLQIEYITYELRLKIYPSSKDKEKFKSILDFKENKIKDICSKNDLNNIFNSSEKRDQIESKIFDEFGNPVEITNKDRYFYYLLKSDFSFRGEGVKLISYNLDERSAVIRFTDGDEESVDLNFIKRIL